jgi:SAM-dependent methyltransferase
MSSLVEQKFGEAAADYATSAVHARGPSLARVVELVAPQAGWRALDVATGAGHTAHTFAPHVAHVIASDITEEMLAQARSLAAAKALGNVETARANAAALPFESESFDLVTCRLAAHHFPDPAAFVGEAWRVLKPRGTLALIDNISPDATTMPTASRAELRDMAIIYNAFEKLRDPSHGRCLALAEWLELLDDAGFVDARYEILDQDIAFGPWTTRMRCDDATAARLEAMLGGEELGAVLKPRVSDGGLMFTLKEAIIVARKVQRE